MFSKGWREGEGLTYDSTVRVSYKYWYEVSRDRGWDHEDSIQSVLREPAVRGLAAKLSISGVVEDDSESRQGDRF